MDGDDDYEPSILPDGEVRELRPEGAQHNQPEETYHQKEETDRSYRIIGTTP